MADRPKVDQKSSKSRPIGWSKIGPSLSARSRKVGLSPRSAQASAQVQSSLTKVPVPSKNIKFGPKWFENRRFGLKLGPEACQDRSGAIGTGLTHSEGPSPAWSWRFKSGPQCRFGPKSSKMVRNGSRINRLARNKDQLNPTTCLDPSGPLLRPKMDKKTTS